MSREIKFKVYAKVPERSDLVFWGYERLSEDGNWEFLRSKRSAWLLGVITDNTGTVSFRRLQFTRLKDKNGVEIYEGDIVEAYNEAALDPDWGLDKIHRGIVSYYENAFCLLCGDVALDKWINAEIIESIGNIYEHKHLLS